MKLEEALRILQRNNFLLEASESDAYKYTKRELDNLPEDLKEDLISNADDPEHWQRECYEKLLTHFSLRNSDALYFTPGLARIAYGELEFDGPNEESGKISRLNRYVHFITTAHKNDFNRKLEYKTGVDNKNKPIYKPCTFKDLDEMFGSVASAALQQEYAEIKDADYKESDYEVVWLKDFETANSYLDYCTADPWCYFEDEDTFEDYENDGRTKLYLLLKKGYQDLEPGDPGYGESMIGIDIDPSGETGVPAILLHASNRYNHQYDPELDERTHPAGDNRYSAAEISQFLGAPFWEVCPPYTDEELKAKGFVPAEEYKTILKKAIESGNPKDAAKKEGYEYGYITLYNEYGEMADIHMLGREVKHQVEIAVLDDDFNILESRSAKVKEEKVGENNIIVVYDHDYDNGKIFKLENNKVVKVINDTVGRVTVNREYGFLQVDSSTTANKYLINKSFTVYKTHMRNVIKPLHDNIVCITDHYNSKGVLLDVETMEPQFDGKVFYNIVNRPEFNAVELTETESGGKMYLYNTKSGEIMDFDRPYNYIEYNYTTMTLKLHGLNNDYAIYTISHNDEPRPLIPWCKDITFYGLENCYVADLGGNRGYDIYDDKYRKILTQLSSLKKLETALRKKGYKW